MSAGPYRYLRNPLYLGTFFHTLALALLMPLSGAVFAILFIASSSFVSLQPKRAFLTSDLASLTSPIARKVPSLFPSLHPTSPSRVRPTQMGHRLSRRILSSGE